MDISQKFENDVDDFKANVVFSNSFKKKKFIAYSIRTSIAIILYVIFWKYSWVRSFLWLHIPLNLLSLISIIGWGFILNKKIENMRSKIENIDAGEDY